jgi:ribosomal protein L39E
MGRENRKSKKKHLEKAGRQTRWAPFWAVLKKYGQGKKVHPSAITHTRRNWRIRKLKIKPRKLRKDYIG